MLKGSLDDPPPTGSNPFDTEPPGLQEEIPVSADPGAAPEAVVDRLAAVRELAGLFDPADSDQDRGPSFAPDDDEAKVPSPVASGPVNGDGRRRVEDTGEMTRGLISRLITGVKGP